MMYDELKWAFLVYILGSLPLGYIYAAGYLNHVIKKKPLSSSESNTNNSKPHFFHHGIIVLSLDILKGYLFINLLDNYLPSLSIQIASFFLVFGHCFPVWTKFKRNKGLTVACGVFMYINPIVIFIWIALWLILKGKIKELSALNFWNVVATFCVISGASFIFQDFLGVNLPSFISVGCLLLATHAEAIWKKDPTQN